MLNVLVMNFHFWIEQHSHERRARAPHSPFCSCWICPLADPHRYACPDKESQQHGITLITTHYLMIFYFTCVPDLNNVTKPSTCVGFSRQLSFNFFIPSRTNNHKQQLRTSQRKCRRNIRERQHFFISYYSASCVGLLLSKI